MSLLYATVVATNAVARHATMTDATVDGERASALSSSVAVVRIAPGIDSNTRSMILPMIIASFGSAGAPGSCCAPCARCHTS